MNDAEVLQMAGQPDPAVLVEGYDPALYDNYEPVNGYESVVAQAAEIADGMREERTTEEADVVTGGMSWAMNKLRSSQPVRWAAGVLSSAAMIAPAAASGAAHTGGKFERKCAHEILAQPEIEQSFMQYAGKRNQSISLKFGFDNVDRQCDSRFRRVVSAMPRLIRGRHAINMDGPLRGHKFWDSMYFPEGNVRNNRAGETGLVNLNSNHLKIRNWKHGDKADFRLRLQEEDARTGKILRTNVTKHPVTVYRGRAPRSVRNR
jgi:hypothetical protein